RLRLRAGDRRPVPSRIALRRRALLAGARRDGPPDAVRVDARRPRSGDPTASASQTHLAGRNARRVMAAHEPGAPAVVLLSGGLDSYTAGAIAKAGGFSLYALTIHYGQRHAEETAAARRVAGALEVERHLEMAIDLRPIGGSALTSATPVPVDR